MSDTFALASFPGINQILSASMTLTQGITPSVCTIEMAPQDGFAGAANGNVQPSGNVQPNGPLVLFDGATTIRFEDCRVESITFDAGSGDQRWRVSIVDRRWKWTGLGKVSGSFNERDGDNKLLKLTEWSPKQLAQYCLDALLEIDYDLSRIPNDLRPALNWDYKPPAAALGELCDIIGAVVVLRLDNTVAVVPCGAGADLPLSLDLQSGSQVADFPAIPSKIAVVGAVTRYQADFPLLAVGWERDNSIAPLEQLSYKPKDGWERVDLGQWNMLGDPAQKNRAEQSVFRWYQLDPARIPLIPGFGKIDELRQILPLNTEQAATVQEDGLGKQITRNKPALVYGVFWLEKNPPQGPEQAGVRLVPVVDGAPGQEKFVYHNSFTINAELGVVQFGERVLKRLKDRNGFLNKPADLILRVAVGVRDARTRAWTRYERLRAEQVRWLTPTRYVVRDDIQRRVVPVYAAPAGGAAANGLWKIDKLNDNQADCAAQADYYLAAAEQEYNRPAPATATYAGLKAIQLDGALQQITWEIGSSGCTTRVSRNMTVVTADTMPYAQRRFFERAAAGQADAARDKVKHAKEAPRQRPPHALVGQNPPPPGHALYG